MGRTSRSRRKKKNQSCFKYNQWSDNDINIVELLKWMRSRNYYNSANLRLANFADTGRGLRATRSIEANELLVSIPEHLLITPSAVLKYDIFQRIQSKWNLTSKELLTLFVAHEKIFARNSEWKYYINSLPKMYSNLSYFSKEDFNQLPLHIMENAFHEHERIFKTCGKLEKLMTIEQLVTDLNEIPRFDWQDQYLKDWCQSNLFLVLLWAYASVNTRCVYLNIPFEESSHSIALAPFLDLLNHSSSASISAGFNPESQCFEIRTLKRYKKYDEVFIKYGNHNNLSLLFEYGFILMDNPDECISFTVDDLVCAVNDISAHGKYKLSEKRQMINENEYHKGLNCSIDGFSWATLASLFILLQENSEIKVWKQSIFKDKMIDSNAKVDEAAIALLEKKLFEYNKTFWPQNSCGISEMIQQIHNDHRSILTKTLRSYDKR